MKNAPACFAISICFDPESSVCARCAFRQECVDRAGKEARKISEVFDEAKKDLIPRFLESRSNLVATTRLSEPRSRSVYRPPRRKSITDAEERKVLRLPSKSKAVAETLMKRGIDIGLYLSHGLVPDFNRNLQYLQAACRMLLNPEGFSRERLTDEFRELFGWSEKTARGYVATTIQVLRFQNAIVENCGQFTVRG